MSKYFTSVTEILNKNGYAIKKEDCKYIISKPVTQKYMCPNRMANQFERALSSSKKKVEVIGNMFKGYEYYTIFNTAFDKNIVVNFDERVKENEQVSSIVEVMMSEARHGNSIADKALLHNLFEIRKQFCPNSKEVIFGHIE